MIPPEIVDHVLSFLQWDQAALKACAQIRCLSKLVERHLYAHLTVETFTSFNPYSRKARTPGTYHPSDLLNLTIDNPNIPTHVRSLRINLYVPSGWLSGGTRIYHELESILPALTRLQAIFLSSSLSTPVDWHQLRESFRTAFTSCLRLPTLSDVKLSNINAFPLAALDHCSSLKRLLLLGSFHYFPSQSSTYPSLDSLVLYQCSSMETVISWTQSRSLRSLDFNGDFRLFSQLLEVCANTLTTLKVHVPHTFRSRYYRSSDHSTPYIPLPFSLACLPHLAQLTIQSSISFTQQFWVSSTSDESRELRLSHSCLPAIMDLLDTLPSPPTNLAFLLISIDIDLDNSFDNISEANWSPLISFPYFDVIPSIELQVRAQKRGREIPSIELLNTLRQDPHLMQLEKHHSFLINPVEEPLES